MTAQQQFYLDRYAPYGFALGDQTKDLGLERDWLVYLARKDPASGHHQYVWVTLDPADGSTLLQALLFSYPKPFNSRVKPSMVPIHSGLLRTQADLDAALGISASPASSPSPPPLS